MINELIDYRKNILYNYSQYSFYPKADKERIFKHSILDSIFNLQNDNDVQFIEIDILGLKHVFILKFLKWDTNYFNIKTYKLLYVLYQYYPR